MQQSNNNSFIPAIYFVSSVNVIFSPFIKELNTYVDELAVLILFIIGFPQVLKSQKGKEFYIVLGILSFYLFYSLLFGQNVYKAVILDFLLFLKPFISFFIPLLISFHITSEIREVMKKFYFLCGVFCVLQLPYIDSIYPNTTSYYQSCIFCGISYLLFSEFSRKDWFCFLIFLTPGLASIKAKFFTEYIFVVYVLFFKNSKIKLNMKWVIIISLIACLSIYVSWEKFSFYFIDGVKHKLPRSMFYALIPQVLTDYFPLGPGFGTFNTEGAARFYSPLYLKYHVNHIFGMRMIDHHSSSNCLLDTFYPALAQFGILGYVFYIKFWMRRWKESLLLKWNTYKLFIIIFFIMAMENLAANSFTGPMGVPYMMILGIILGQKEYKYPWILRPKKIME